MAYDVKDFDSSFVHGLSLKDGAATLTEYTADILAKSLDEYSKSFDSKIILTGGGRKNKFLKQQGYGKRQNLTLPMEVP